MPKKQIIMYIASPKQAAEFKNRCASISEEVEIATLKDFGAEPPHDSFLKMQKLMKNGSIDWTIFHWKDVSSLIGGQVFIKELRELIQSGACKRSKTYVVDPDETLTSKDAFASYGIGIVKDETAIGMPFAKMLNLNQLEIEKASKENSAFEKISAPDYSAEEGRLPGMSAQTPSRVGKQDTDPFNSFSQIKAGGDEDPFASYAQKSGNGTQSAGGDSSDPSSGTKPSPFDAISTSFGAAGGGANMPTAAGSGTAVLTSNVAGNGDGAGNGNAGPGNDTDIFFELADDLGADLAEESFGSGEDLFDDNLFSVLEQAADETIANAPAGASDPFAAFEYMDNNDVLGGADAFADGDPFTELEEKLEKEETAAVSVESVIGGIGGVMNGSAVADEVVGESETQLGLPAPGGAGNAAGGNVQLGTGAQDPFAAFDGLAEADEDDEKPMEFDGSIFDDMPEQEDVEGDLDPFDGIDKMSGTDVFGDGEFDDPYGEMTDEDYEVANTAFSDSIGGGRDGNGEEDFQNGSNGLGTGIVTAGDPFGGREEITLDEIFDFYGDRLGVNEYNKLFSMLEPDWDYELEHADGIGLAGGSGSGGLFGGGGKKKAGKTYSQVDEYTLAESEYIPEMEALNGRYSPPDECKILISTSAKGGIGKACLCSILITKVGADGNPERTTVGEIRPGDYVYNRLGKPVKVISTHPQGELDVYEITLKDGRKVECSGDHLWNVLHRGSNRARDHHREIHTTEELMEKSSYKNEGKGKQEYRWKIPVADAIEFPEQDLPLDPYLVGLLIGDGCLTHSSPELSSGDIEIVEKIRPMLREIGVDIHKQCPNNPKQYTWVMPKLNRKTGGTNPLKKILDDLDLCHRTEGKFIPEIYMMGSIEQRRALLQGLMDSDGSSNKGRFSFTTINRRLKDQFMSLVRSLGYICSASLDNRSEKYCTGECWIVHVQSNDVENIFRLQRKKDDYYACKSKQTPAKKLPQRKEITQYTADDNNGCAPLDIESAPVHPYLLGLLFSRRKIQHDKPIKFTCRDDFILHHAIECLPAGVDIIPEVWVNPKVNPDGRSFVIQKTDTAKQPYNIKTPLHLLLADMGLFNDPDAGYSVRTPSGYMAKENASAAHKEARNKAAAARASSAIAQAEIMSSHGDDLLGAHIPSAYLHGTQELRQALLQGIMDGAGIFAINSCLPMINMNRNPHFASQFRELVENLGYTIQDSTSKRDKNCLLIATDDTSIFYSDDKREQMHNFVDTAYSTKMNSWMGNDDRYISIADIKKTDRKEEMTCLYVDDEEHLFLVGDYIPTHNSSVAVGIATQLNWYFNKKLMQKMTTSYQSRVLLLSINEFDDIPVHGIGYESFSTANDEDGRNVAELLRRIDDTGGNPSWDDIMHCFVSTEQNRVFYLPSLTQREILEDNINITAEDYRKVFEVCSKFFQFIVVDTPDIFYQEKNDLMNFVYSVADVICMVIEPDQRSITNLYHFFNGLEVETGRTPLNPAKCMLVVNKYVEKGNPYMVMPFDQLDYKDITMSTEKYFSRFACIPFTHPRGKGNVIYGTDPKVKYAFADLADSILDMIAQNDAAEEQKKKRRKA